MNKQKELIDRMNQLCDSLDLEFDYEAVTKALLSRGTKRMVEVGGLEFAMANLLRLSNKLPSTVVMDKTNDYNIN
ncbi:MAG: hypothetical protein JMN25_14375 [gamma proteobacterium endosymbiont of Lamellibrachia anaximandri]|nr:hypothetical protein [gamma proteobacterium endosymbiont of Lamellibrachia anaximandri]